MLLNRPHKVVYYGTACNYQCSYCLVDPVRDTYPGNNFDIEGTVSLLRDMAPSVISVSGGETGIWPHLPELIQGLEAHRFILCTNLSRLPESFFHPRVDMLLATFHFEMATEDAFFDNARKATDRGMRMHAKIIVKQGAERQNLRLWEKLNAHGIPASFVPLEIYGRDHHTDFDPGFLRDVATDYLTSTILNGRFFRTFPDYRIPSCMAGTDSSFLIAPDGKLWRCAIEQHSPARAVDENGEKCEPTVRNPAFLASPMPCTASSGNCICEYHHWGDLAPGNDNEIWEHYLREGTWNPPKLDDLKDFMRAMHWPLEPLESVL